MFLGVPGCRAEGVSDVSEIFGAGHFSDARGRAAIHLEIWAACGILAGSEEGGPLAQAEGILKDLYEICGSFSRWERAEYLLLNRDERFVGQRKEGPFCRRVYSYITLSWHGQHLAVAVGIDNFCDSVMCQCAAEVIVTAAIVDFACDTRDVCSLLNCCRLLWEKPARGGASDIGCDQQLNRPVAVIRKKEYAFACGQRLENFGGLGGRGYLQTVVEQLIEHRPVRLSCR